MLWEFIGLLVLVVLATVRGRVGRAGPFWMILFALPSTLLHELAHFLVALVTGGRPSRITIFPRSTMVQMSDGRTQKMWVLGSVHSQMGIFSAFPTAIAPLVYIPAAYLLFQNWYGWFPATIGATLALYVLIFLFLTSALPSDADWKIVVSHPGSFLLYALLVMTGYVAKDQIINLIV